MLLAIDPSINDVGLAYLDHRGNFISSSHIRPSTSERGNVVQKIDSIFIQLQTYLCALPEDCNEVIIEHTRFFARNQNRSHASAQKLNLVKGMIYGLCKSHGSLNVIMVWLPNFSKDSANLLAKAHRLPKVSQHERDAFWLGNTWCHTNKVLRQEYIQHPDL